MGLGREAAAAHAVGMGRVGAASGECRPQGRTTPGRPHPADCCLICSVDRADKQADLLAILTSRAPFPEPRASGCAARAEDGGPRAPSACACSASARGPPPVSPPIERSRRAA
ncbi:hypothetical protein A1351_15005 [Methylosinus sp. R-45379]|nr:hypothetical protein A1351_15005 [Methylosinus sp. R-45379]TDX60422.1 hypothetical protein EDE12_12119 [Methylosinus sp. sav-2]